jgi:pimeloyl-ACP methyl ester carboxylesterase
MSQPKPRPTFMDRFDRLGSLTDAILTGYSAKQWDSSAPALLSTRIVNTPAGPVRLYDSGTNLPCVVITPDGPNVIEHYAALISLLSPHVRVVCFDMPGFGHSVPHKGYLHSLDQGASVVVGLLDVLGIDKATLAFSCANGFYALRVAQIAPHRISQLVLSQTPSLRAMRAWARRAIPWPVLLPVAGQIGVWLFRRRLARGWYHSALPRDTDPNPYAETALHALDHGGCFCLAGVAQGLAREPDDTLNGISVAGTMIWGAKDRSHRHTDPASILQYAPGLELIRFEDVGHFPDLEQPRRYADLLLNVLLNKTLVNKAQRQRSATLSR